MPPPTAEDDDYVVSASPAVVRAISRLQEQAKEEHREKEFNQALKLIYERLRRNPREVGDARKNMRGMHAQLRGVAVRPIFLEFAVHNTERIVFIGTVMLMGRSPKEE